METLTSQPPVIIMAPAGALRPYVDRYWLSRASGAVRHTVLPDGAVDVVLEMDGSNVQSWVYGTTTDAMHIPVRPHAQYLGIRFKPGQSRHFVKAAAHELTNGCATAHELVRFSLDALFATGLHQRAESLLNEMLLQRLAQVQPVRHRIDEAIALIEANLGSGRIREVAACFGNSQRQFERVFLETVGISAKQFASIARFHHAATLIAEGMELAQVAVAAGFSDQSHMSNEFRRLTGMSPRRFSHPDVVFFQD